MPSSASLRLAEALAARLDAVAPPAFGVRAERTIALPAPFAEAEGSFVSVYVGAERDSGTDVAGVLDQYIDPASPDAERWSFVRRVCLVADNAMNALQDAVAEATAESWPVLPDGGMAMPETRTDGERVFLWYGTDEAAAVLRLPPIELAALGPGAGDESRG